MTYLRRYSALLTLLLTVTLVQLGCTDGSTTTEEPNSREPATENTSTAAGADETPLVLLEPFDAPSLAEIDASAEWIDQPLGDSMKMLQEYLAQLGPAEISVEEALTLPNNSAEANEKIADAMGRLPANDQEVDYEASISRHLPGDVKSMNPLLISSTSEFTLSGLTSFGILSFDWNLKHFAATESVVSWQTSKDHLMDKFVLRDDLTWSDGKPITAHDVVFSFKTIMDPRVPVPAVRSGTDKLRWVEAYDDQTLVFFHKEASPVNALNLSFPVIPKHIYENTVDDDPTLTTSKVHITLEQKPIVGGAYEVVRRDRNNQIILARRDSYFMHNGEQVREKPYFKEIRLKVIADPSTALIGLKSGQIDEMELSSSQWLGQTDDAAFRNRNVKASGLEWTSFHFVWNFNNPIFQDKRVRYALAYAFDHDEMLNKLLGGLNEPSTGPFHPTAWMAPSTPSTPFKQDLDKAEDLLDEAGWHYGAGNIREKTINGRVVPLKFSILVGQQPERVRICELLKMNLERIGVECTITVLESTVLQQYLFENKFDAAMGGWGTGTDPYTLENIYGTGENRNFGSYSNPEVDKLFKQGMMEFDREKRAAIYAKIHELVYEDQPYMYLYFRNSFYGFNKDLRGWRFSPRGPYHYGPGFSSIWRVAQ